MKLLSLFLPWRKPTSGLPLPSDATGDDSFEARMQRWQYQVEKADDRVALLGLASAASVVVWISPLLWAAWGGWVMPLLLWVKGVAVWVWTGTPGFLRLYLELTPLPVFMGWLTNRASKRLNDVKLKKPGGG